MICHRVIAYMTTRTTQRIPMTINLETSSPSASLSPCAISGNWSNIFNPTNAHSRPSKSSKRRLSTRSRSFRTVSYISATAQPTHRVMITSSSADFDMESCDSQLFAPCRNILCSQHGCIRGTFISISFHFHSAYIRTVEVEIPVIRTMVSFPDKSVTWTKVSLKDAKMCATPNTSSPSRICGPRVTTSSFCATFFFGGCQ
jgi:hypothetical protein